MAEGRGVVREGSRDGRLDGCGEVRDEIGGDESGD